MKLNQTWSDMKRRCYSPQREDYRYYGARGIKVCDRWLDPFTGLQTFIADMAPTWFPGATLDRKDVNGDYSPDNCRWVTRTEQNRNQRQTILTAELAEEIRTKHRWARHVDTAKIYNVTRETITDIMNNRTWKRAP